MTLTPARAKRTREFGLPNPFPFQYNIPSNSRVRLSCVFSCRSRNHLSGYWR